MLYLIFMVTSLLWGIKKRNVFIVLFQRSLIKIKQNKFILNIFISFFEKLQKNFCISFWWNLIRKTLFLKPFCQNRDASKYCHHRKYDVSIKSLEHPMGYFSFPGIFIILNPKQESQTFKFFLRGLDSCDHF